MTPDGVIGSGSMKKAGFAIVIRGVYFAPQRQQGAGNVRMPMGCSRKKGCLACVVAKISITPVFRQNLCYSWSLARKQCSASPLVADLGVSPCEEEYLHALLRTTTGSVKNRCLPCAVGFVRLRTCQNQGLHALRVRSFDRIK
mmetsp:Transcript_126598/g.246747  ORF Transcript_126598/g.246747 Transcript_126598/m.246747 type:complete len:143 (-) Transcript_126598:431-859(-)